MSADPNKKSPRTFQCRDALWDKFEQMARELECSVDYLINDAMKQYARQRNYVSSASASVGSLNGGQQERYGSAPAPPPPGYRPATVPPPVQGGGRLPPPPNGGQLRSSGGLPLPPPTRGGGAPAPPSQRGSLPAPPQRGGSFPPPPPGRSGSGGMNPPTRNEFSPQQQAPMSRGAPPPVMNAPPPPMQQQQQPSYRNDNGYGGAAQSASLTVIYNGERISVSKDRFVIGRGKQSSDLTLKDPNVSRQHAMIEFQNGAYFMVDMGSTNGVEYNGQRIARKQIAEGDVYRICDHDLRFTFR